MTRHGRQRRGAPDDAGNLARVSATYHLPVERSSADGSAVTELDVPATERSVRLGRFARLLPALSALAITVLVIWRTGPGKVPGPEGFEATARIWPHQPLAPEAAYVLRQGLGQALYHALGWVGTRPYLALHAATLLISGLVLSGWLLRRLGAQRGTIAVCLLLLSPVTAVLLEWIGLYDAFSVLVWVLLFLTLRGKGWLQFAVAVLGGLQNFEQFVVSVILLALLPEAGRPFGLRARPVALLVGALLGKVVLEAYLTSEGASSGSRAAFLENPEMLHYVLTTFAVLAPIIIYTVLGPLWIPVVHRLPAAWAAGNRSLRLRVVAVGAIVLGMGILSADHTRVMALITFPLLVVLCMLLATEWDSVRNWLRNRETWLLLLVPPFVIVSGGSPLPLGLDLSSWGL
jgi:hypothetical protein